MKDYITICSSAPSEVLAIIALRNREAILERNLAIIRSNLSHLRFFFHKHEDRLQWEEPKAGTVVFPRLLGSPSSASTEQYCEALVQQHGVMLLPATVYGYEEPCFRLGFGRSNLPRVLEVWDEVLRREATSNEKQ